MSDCKHERIEYTMQHDFLDDGIIYRAKCEACKAVGDWEDSKESAVASLRKETPSP